MIKPVALSLHKFTPESHGRIRILQPSKDKYFFSADIEVSPLRQWRIPLLSFLKLPLGS